MIPISNHFVALCPDGSVDSSPKEDVKIKRQGTPSHAFCFSENLCPGQADMQVHASRGHASPHKPGRFDSGDLDQKRERVDLVAGTRGRAELAAKGSAEHDPTSAVSSRDANRSLWRVIKRPHPRRRGRCTLLHTDALCERFLLRRKHDQRSCATFCRRV